MVETITSRDNPRVKQLARLLSRKKDRDEAGLFAAEGLRLCLDAARSGVEIPCLLLTEKAGEKYPETRELIVRAKRTEWIAEHLAGKISDTQNPQGVFAVCGKLDNSPTAVTIKDGGRYLLLSRIQEPGNLGTILRTADALGVSGVFLDRCTDLYGPKALRASMGGVFRLPMVITDDILADIARMQAKGIAVYAAALQEDAATVTGLDFAKGGAVLIGNEGNGLEQELIGACNQPVCIPMARGADSLNAAMAAGILLWEMCRGSL